MQLPKAVPTNTQSNPDETMLNIQVSEQGTFYWKIGTGGAEAISESEIAPRLEQYRNQHPTNARVLIRGDNRAKFGAAVMVLDEVRKAGIAQVSVETVSSPTGR